MTVRKKEQQHLSHSLLSSKVASVVRVTLVKVLLESILLELTDKLLIRGVSRGGSIRSSSPHKTERDASLVPQVQVQVVASCPTDDADACQRDRDSS
jgi:hypothetical protein